MIADEDPKQQALERRIISDILEEDPSEAEVDHEIQDVFGNLIICVNDEDL